MTDTPDDLARRARSFGAVAESYERYRPSYPERLVADVVALAPGTRCLDVGAGTGKGTRLLAAAGLDVVALEPDPAMAGVLARELPGVEVLVETFEECSAAGPFDVLASAQAWHWTDPETHWERARSLLVPGGVVALFWNHNRLTGVDDDAVHAVYAEHAPRVQPDTGDGSVETARLVREWPGPEMQAAEGLRDHEVRQYRWERTMPRAEYLAYLDTQSPYRILEDDARAALLAGLEAVLPETVVLDMVTVLHLARTA